MALHPYSSQLASSRKISGTPRRDRAVPGGKSLSGDGSHSPRFTIRLDKATAQAVRDSARREGKSTAKLLRQVVTAPMAN